MVHMAVSVCMRVWVCVCACMYGRVCVHACTGVCVHACMGVCVHACVSVCPPFSRVLKTVDLLNPEGRLGHTLKSSFPLKVPL